MNQILACESGWTRHDYGDREVCFKHFDETRPNAAKSVCDGESATQILPASEDENNDLLDFMDSKSLSWAWLAINDVASEGNWADNDGAAFTGWTKWKTGAPDNSGDEDYAYISRGGRSDGANRGEWNDTKNYRGFAICYKAAPATTVDSCNDSEGVIQLTATLRNVSGSYGQDSNGQITFTRSQLNSSFDGNNLVMSTVLGGSGCTQTQVDGATVCTQVGEQITLQCKYALEDVVLDDSFQVTGQDTAATAEGTGTLNYVLAVDDNKSIGERIQFTITPVNAGLVFATVKSCDVTNAATNDELTIIGHGRDYCTNPVVNAVADTTRFTSQNEIQGTWTAFKWSTAADDNTEAQGLRCTIGLSQLASQVDVTPCELSNN